MLTAIDIKQKKAEHAAQMEAWMAAKTYSFADVNASDAGSFTGVDAAVRGAILASAGAGSQVTLKQLGEQLALHAEARVLGLQALQMANVMSRMILQAFISDADFKDTGYGALYFKESPKGGGRKLYMDIKN